MIAVILAAGRGTRLEAITRNKPKCLVHVNGQSILDRQVQELLDIDAIGQIVVLCGYRSEQVTSHLAKRYPGESRLICVENKEFATTNNMYSLLLAHHHAKGQELLLMNGDVLVAPDVLRSLVQMNGNAICVDVGAYAEESMKVVEKNGHLVSIGKRIPSSRALGISTDVYMFSASGTDALFEEVIRRVERDGQRNEWTEVALNSLMQNGTLTVHSCPTKGHAWHEIDTPEDLRLAEEALGQSDFDWDSAKLAFIDMDGTLFCGNVPVPGADAFFEELTRRVPHVFLLSNNSSRIHKEYVSLLSEMGIHAEPGQILLSSDALCASLLREGISHVFAVGTESFIELLADHGISTGSENPEAVVLAYDTELTYEKMERACLLLQNGEIPYYATHMDMVCPTDHGDVPDIGALASLIQATTGREPNRTFGKPELGMVQHVYDRLGFSPNESVFLGDRVYTDYAMASRCQSRFIGVLSGDAERVDFERCRNITVFPSVASVFSAKEPG